MSVAITVPALEAIALSGSGTIAARRHSFPAADAGAFWQRRSARRACRLRSSSSLQIASSQADSRERSRVQGLVEFIETSWPRLIAFNEYVNEAGDEVTVMQSIGTIRDHLPQVGKVNEFAGGLEWHGGPGLDKTAITFTPSPRGTVIRVDGRNFDSKFTLFMSAGAITAVAGLAGLGVSPELGAGLGLGTLAITFTSARLLWNRLALAGRRKLERLVVALADQLDRSAAS